ncbi:hypothetical protein [Paenibacillus illinoisensis]|uniref:hypothetical protein n=1 Tax=Paenibacillus illinoisensis TaxID=59845 RepID=UPI00301A6962
MNFTLSDQEVKNAKRFMEETHGECAKQYLGATGGHFSYTFVPDSIGLHISIRCGVCKEKENITDYDMF